MDEKALSSLTGKTLTEVAKLHDYVQFAFGQQTRLSVYNPVHACPGSFNSEALIGKRVASIDSNETQIVIAFENGVRLEIDMRPESFRGPEAMQLDRDGLPTIVWN